jgi:uncharacterized repeat protein (TIGR01451 family)
VVASLQALKTVDRTWASPGEELQYHVLIMNDMLAGPDPGAVVRVRDPLPVMLELVPGSLSPGVSYVPATRTVQWQGAVPRGGSVDLVFRATLSQAAASMRSVINTAIVTDAFDRELAPMAQTHIFQETPTITPTATPTQPGDLALHGKVYDAEAGLGVTVGGASVEVKMCVPRTFSTISALDGRYELLLTALYLNQCTEVTLQATASGYEDHTQVVSVSSLRAQPALDIGLQPLSTRTPTPTQPVRHVHLPLVRKSQGS